MKQRELDKLNAYLHRWQGATASFNYYVGDSDDRLTIVLERADNPRERIGVSFMHCLFLSGPTRWPQCDLQCEAWTLPDGWIGFEVRDAGSEFLLRCAGPVVVGDSELIVPHS